MAGDPVLVFGATGTHGGAVARELLSEQFTVHAFVRDASSERALALAQAGARLVVGDLDDGPSVARALGAVAVAYAVTTPFEGGAQEELRQGHTILQAAASSELPWLIFASVAAAARADVPHFQSKARIERDLEQSPLAWTVLAPSYFYENLDAVSEAIRAGRLPLALPADKPLHQLALRDLGATVAAVLRRRQEHLSVRVELAADSPTPREMAAALGARFIQTPLQELRERNPDLAAMYAFLAKQGYAIDTAAVRARYPEVAWTSFAAWAAERLQSSCAVASGAES